ncbi:mothers against decapentaplegic homolog 6 [Musca domestica]|uniref:Mothers against decapentaplegic homolog n=1 Tax=Musca domestica TaxID=7370 RepID=A0A9J7I1M8_MUSDO|nr:mothers against decapentaplegic homolog 6 [Musca domestica]
MKFQSEKKELWRYASKNLTTPVRGTTRQPPPPHRLPPQHHPHASERSLSRQQTFYCDVSGESSSTMSLRPQLSTPPPPYSATAVDMDCVNPRDYCQTFRQPQAYVTDGETETSLSATESETGYGQRPGGYSYVNTGDIMHVDEYEKLNEISSGSSSSNNTTTSSTNSTSTFHLTKDLSRMVERTVTTPRRAQSKTNISLNPVATTLVNSATTLTSATTSFAATAAKILRNCCGGGFGSSNSIVTATSSTNHDPFSLNPTTTMTTTTVANNNNNSTMPCNKESYENSKNMATSAKTYFDALMKELKARQITSLLKAVKSRHEPTTKSSTAAACSSNSVTTYQTNCILMRRAEILGEEPYVIVCRLFLWRDLNNSSQLKRLPVCPNERDPVYVCCNPLHWSRILETESAPPPYRSQRMDRNEGLSFQNYGNSTSFGSSDADGVSSIQKPNTDFYVRMTESVTTDGEASRCSPNWCEVAYWELGQRVGERYPAETPTINIYSEKPYSSANGDIEGMCLKDLIEKRTTPSPSDVQNTRQKIGLGVTLSQETDGVWLYNRATVPIFVYSPTLTDSLSRVYRVEPGDCLRAFDIYKAHTLVYSDQFPGVQTGPIDKFSMRISFGKGWGFSYKRPDITRCPCWLEVLFRPQR